MCCDFQPLSVWGLMGFSWPLPYHGPPEPNLILAILRLLPLRLKPAFFALGYFLTASPLCELKLQMETLM